PETAPVVKRIFELYAGGTGIRKICAILESEQIMRMTASITLRAVRAEKLHELTHNIILYPL
ncbi:MAG: recombinase family protein, partial [Clostridia bacterium]|nr:recombinase family protein [Clostridia bacterium]